MVLGEEIRFGLIERSRQVKPAASPKAKSSVAASYEYNPIKLEPTRILSAEIWNYYSGGPQKVWWDRNTAPLEAQLAKCIAGMIRMALRKRAERKALGECSAIPRPWCRIASLKTP
jgi:hypothetical protein